MLSSGKPKALVSALDIYILQALTAQPIDFSPSVGKFYSYPHFTGWNLLVSEVCEHVPVSTEMVESFQDRLDLPKEQFEVENYLQIQVGCNEEFCQKENQGNFFSQESLNVSFQYFQSKLRHFDLS